MDTRVDSFDWLLGALLLLTGGIIIGWVVGGSLVIGLTIGVFVVLSVLLPAAVIIGVYLAVKIIWLTGVGLFKLARRVL